MRIYVFTITGYLSEDITIAQVYSKDFYIAWNTIAELTGAKDCEIDFVGMEVTTDPINYDNVDINYILNN